MAKVIPLLLGAAYATSLNTEVEKNNVFTGSGTLPTEDIQAHAGEFDFDESFLTSDEFQDGVNNHADVYIAIEAFIRTISRDIRPKVAELEYDSDNLHKAEQRLMDLIGLVGANEDAIMENKEGHTANAGEIVGLYDQFEDLAGKVCLSEEALRLFCHRFIYQPMIPDECAPILLTIQDRLEPVYDWNGTF